MIFPSTFRRARAATCCVALLIFLAACNRQSRRAEQNATPIPVDQEQHHHLLMTNDYVHVYRAELASGATMKLHRHDHDYVAVYLTDAQLEEFVPGKPVHLIRHQTGQVRFSQAPLTHRVTNTGGDFRVIVAELMKAPSGRAENQPSPEGEHSLDLGHGHIEDVMLNNSRVQATDLQIAPGMRSDDDAGANPQLIVWVADGELASGSGEHLHGKLGDVSWLNGNSGSLQNTGSQTAHVIAVQFKSPSS